MKNIVLFGAGKIGRSFIAQLFSKSGYEVIFIDINSDIIKALNEKKNIRSLSKENMKKPFGLNKLKGLNLTIL